MMTDETSLMKLELTTVDPHMLIYRYYKHLLLDKIALGDAWNSNHHMKCACTDQIQVEKANLLDDPWSWNTF
jgi:hypothetical protein